MVGREPWVLREGTASWRLAIEPKEASRAVTASERAVSAPLGGVACPMVMPCRSSAVADGAGDSCNGGTLNGCPLLLWKGLLRAPVWLAAFPAHKHSYQALQ